MALDHFFRWSCFFVFCIGAASVWAGPYSALLIEPESNRVLYEESADELRYPASLTKMMTLYLVFDALTRGRLSLQDALTVSHYAATRPPSKLGLKPGDTITVEQSILGLVTRSANDAAIVLAEGLAGTEAAFAKAMTRKAWRLGMRRTVFQNASGLPDPEQVTTAWDMFRLARALQTHFPEHYRYFSTANFYFHNRPYRNHNRLLESYPGTDGIKTGYISASGYNLVASVRRNGIRLIGVVFGGESASERDAHMCEILDAGFMRLERPLSGVRLAQLPQIEIPTLLHRPESVEKLTLAAGAVGSYEHRGERPSSVDSRDYRSGQRARPRAAGEKSFVRGSWQVNVGSFPKMELAEQRLSKVRKAIPNIVRQARVAITSYSRRGKKIYVAYFKGLSQMEANSACQTLRRKNLGCSLVASAS
jgi:D-alanyl-D-alanine carboxypeptidase